MKGVVFTILLTVMALSLLSLVLIFSNEKFVFSQEISRFGVYDRMDNEIKYIENGYRKIIGNVINISVSGNNATITENIPYDYLDFYENVDGFASFISNSSNFDVSLDNVSIKDMKMIIKPGNIVYDHIDGLGKNRLSISNTTSVMSYRLDMSISSRGSINISCDCQSGSDKLIIFVTTMNESTIRNYDIDFNEESEIDILIDNRRIDVDIGDEKGSLYMNNQNTLSMSFKIVIEINTTFPIIITLPEETINITSKDDNISRSSFLRVG